MPDNELQHVGVLGMKWGKRKVGPEKDTVDTVNRILNDKRSSGADRNEAMRRIGVDERGQKIKDFNPVSKSELQVAKQFVEKYKMTPRRSKNYRERERSKKIVKAILAAYAGVALTAAFAPRVIRTAAWVTGKTTYIGPAN